MARPKKDPSSVANAVRADMNKDRPPTQEKMREQGEELVRQVGRLPPLPIHLITGRSEPVEPGDAEEIRERFPDLRKPYVVTVLSEDVRAAIVENVRKGAFLDVACYRAGVSPAVVKSFIARAEMYPGTVFSTFAIDLNEAAAEAETQMVDHIFSAAKKEQFWTAAAWWLERTKPDKYAQKAVVKHQVEHEVQQLMRHLERNLPPDVFKQVVAAIVKGNPRLESDEEVAMETIETTSTLLALPETTD